MTFSIMTFSIMTFSIMTLSTMTFSITTNKHHAQYNGRVLLCCVFYTGSHLWDCHKVAIFAECHYADCHYAECLGAVAEATT
jgi:hypothetical protein